MTKHTDSLTTHSSMSTSPLLLGDTLANSITAGWDARTPFGFLVDFAHRHTSSFYFHLFISSCLPGTKLSSVNTSKCLKDEYTGQRNIDIWELDLGLLVDEQDRQISILMFSFINFFPFCNKKTDRVYAQSTE